VPGVLLDRLGPFPGRIDAELVRRYAAATNDPNEASRSGSAVPPAAVVTQIWEAQEAGFAALVPAPVRSSMAGGVHGQHDILLHRPIAPGEPLQTWVEGFGSRRGGRHNLVTMRYLTHGDDGELIAEQWWTTVLLQAAGDPVGEAPPDHAVDRGAPPSRVGTYDVHADDEMPRRYAEVSGDWSAHHFDVEAARRSGADRTFLHGLCTLALCAQGIVAMVAGGDPERVRRLAVRFAAPTFVGEHVEVHIDDVGDRQYVFEAASAGAVVIRNGFAELRP